MVRFGSNKVGLWTDPKRLGLIMELKTKLVLPMICAFSGCKVMVGPSHICIQSIFKLDAAINFKENHWIYRKTVITLEIY